MLDSLLPLPGLESECENGFYSPVDVWPPNSMTDGHILHMTAGTKSWRWYRYSFGWMSVPPLPERMISWLGSSTQLFRAFHFLLAHCFGFAAHSYDVLIQSNCSHTVVFSSCFTHFHMLSLPPFGKSICIRINKHQKGCLKTAFFFTSLQWYKHLDEAVLCDLFVDHEEIHLMSTNAHFWSE